MLKMSQQGIDILQNKYGKRLLQQVSLKNYSTARVGGNADLVYICKERQ